MLVHLFSFLLAFAQVFHFGGQGKVVSGSDAQPAYQVPAHQGQSFKTTSILKKVKFLLSVEEDTDDTEDETVRLMDAPCILVFSLPQSADVATAKKSYCIYRARSALISEPLFLLHRNFRI